MLEVTLLYNKSNQFGTARDVEGIMAAIGSTYTVKHSDPLEPPAPTDLAIHLEIPVYAWMPWATHNVLVVNPEWFCTAWIPYMPRFQFVIYKDRFSAEEAIAAGYVTREQVRVVPWGAAPWTAKKAPKGTADTGFVWFLGSSVNKRAYVPTLLSQWKETYPPLRIYTVEPLDVSGGSNVRIEVRDLSTELRQSLASFFRGHICCSKAEGFSYPAAEAEWLGAYTIMNDLNCYRADYTGCKGAYILGDLDAAIAEFEAMDFETLSVRQARAGDRWDAFLERFAAVVAEVPVGERVPHLPPILWGVDCPTISIVTLLYNRRKFFELACHNMIMSDYPKNKIEWIIVEDSDDPMEDASDRIAEVANTSAPLRIVYVPLRKKQSVAAKRNLGVEKATSDIVLMMDDDDHYPETSFRRRVAWLTLHPWKPKAVAAATIACYDLVKGISAVNVPPMDIPLGQRISEATLTFYKSWWQLQKFPVGVQVGEGEGFLSGREADVLEVPPQQIIVAFSHGKNTSSRRIPSGAEVKPGCFWGFPPEFLTFIHGLAGITVVGS